MNQSLEMFEWARLLPSADFVAPRKLIDGFKLGLVTEQELMEGLACQPLKWWPNEPLRLGLSWPVDCWLFYTAALV